MNRLKASIESDAIDWGDGVRWARPASGLPDLPERTPLVLGIRPEHVRLGPASGGSLQGQGIVQMLEPLGAETLVTLAIGTQSLICRADADIAVKPGHTLEVAMDLRQLQAFQIGTGERW
jgi:multiple sugar transport system ATP-binding protein